MKRISFSFATALFICSAVAQAQPVNQFPTTKVWDVYEHWKNCYGQDFGNVLHRQGWDRYVMFYGKISDQFGGLTSVPDARLFPGAEGWNLGAYSENIWVTWSMTDGKSFGQEAGVKPPLLLITSLDFVNFYNSHLPPGAPVRYLDRGTCWVIGDAAGEVGNKGIWYLFFDTEEECGVAPAQGGIYAASSKTWHSGYQIRGKAVLPGIPPFFFPSVFREPDTGELYLYYSEAQVYGLAGRLRGVKIVDDGVGLTYEPLNGDKPVISSGAEGFNPARRISVFKYGRKYYAVTDRLGEGYVDDFSANQLFLLGPSDKPYGFDWRTRKTILTRQDGTFFDKSMWAPSVVSPDDGDPANVRVYFWGTGSPGCGPNVNEAGHGSAGLLELPVSKLP
ncbi:MAG: hypothetical protein Q7S36_03005 [Candidatus Liptonbacteria bacterium]|nr:hypothetical protein [Candidatus Liptonbacteria bacterium]